MDSGDPLTQVTPSQVVTLYNQLRGNTSLLPQWRYQRPLQDLLSAIDRPEETLRFVGGCVRDSFLGFGVKDIDLATQHSPDMITDMVHKAGFKTVPVGISHGTVRVLVGRDTYEITTLRTDTKTDGRHATVAFTTDWYEDAARRDFTCNALYLTLSGDLYDPFKGRKDLREGRLRFIRSPEDRLKEDFLRALRFFRFYGRFGRVNPDAATVQALYNSCATLRTLSKERITNEIKGILSLSTPLKALHLMSQTSVLPTLLGEGVQCHLLEKVCCLERCLPLPSSPPPDWILRLASLLYPSLASCPYPRKAKGYAFLEDFTCLRLSLKEQARLKRFLEYAVPVSDPLENLTSLLYHYGTKETTSIVLLREALYSLVKSVPPSKKRVRAQQALLSISRWGPKTFPLTGRDALSLDLRGKVIGALLDRVEKWWLAEHCTPSRKDCLERMAQLARPYVKKLEGYDL